MMRMRLVALTAIWSWDHWLDVTHNALELRAPNTGPDEYEHILVREFEGIPADARVEDALHDLREELTQVDGRAELSSYTLLDDEAWLDFLAPRGHPIATIDPDVPFALIHHHTSLRSALEVSASARVPLVEDRADGRQRGRESSGEC